MQYTVIGDANQCIVTQMTLGDEVKSEIGSMVFLSDGVALEASDSAPMMKVGDLPAINSPVPLTHFRCLASRGMVSFAAPFPGQVRELSIKGGAWLCSSESFICCSNDVNAQIAFARNLEAGYYNERGFVLYKLTGYGEAYVHGGGNVVEYDLAVNQRIAVEAGCVTAFQESVAYNMELFAGMPSAKGGEGLSVVTLTGPGRIYLATLPLSRLVQSIRGQGRMNPTRMDSSVSGNLSSIIREF